SSIRPVGAVIYDSYASGACALKSLLHTFAEPPMRHIAEGKDKRIIPRPEQIDTSCSILMRLSEHIPLFGVTRSVRDMAHGLSNYIDAELRLHVEEQEEFFTTLAAEAEPEDLPELERTIDQCKSEHRALQQVWLHLRITLQNLALCRVGSLATSEMS